MKNKMLILALLAAGGYWLWKKKNPTLVALPGMTPGQATTPGSSQTAMLEAQNVGLSGMGEVNTRAKAINLIEQRHVDVMPHGYQQLESQDVLYQYQPDVND